MQRFLTRILSYFLLLIFFMAALDFAFTSVYESARPRTKFQLLRSLANKKTNYIFLGSSRVDNGIVPEVITQKTGKTAVNLGFQAAKLDDIYSLLKIIDAYHVASDTIFIQIDYIYNVPGRSIQLPFEMAPFIRDNEPTAEYFSNIDDGKAMYYVPFYRYCAYEQKIGCRELAMNLLNKETGISPNAGYTPLQGSNVASVFELPEKLVHNATFDSIRNFCRRKNIKAVFYTAPFWNGTKNLDYISKLKSKIPGLHDFSNAVTDPNHFNNGSHLNDSGARKFTAMIADSLLLRK